MTAVQVLTCPYCWQSIEVVVDLSAGEQEYVEDCSVCCRPIVVHYVADSEQVLAITARAENE